MSFEESGIEQQNESAAASERRSGPRRKLEAEIGLNSQSQFYVGFSEDLSDGGLFVATYERIPLDSAVHVSFELPSGTRVSTAGRVVWVREASEEHAPGVGVAFDSLSEEEREAILEFVRERPPLFYTGAG